MLGIMDERSVYAAVVGQLIQRLRGAVSQATLAKRAGLSQSALSRFENGQSMPDIHETRRLAGALGRSPADFVSLVERSYERATTVAKKTTTKKAISSDIWSDIAAVAIVGLAIIAVAAILEEG